ncbi:MAG: amidohydrolase family protein [Terriglobales bacterium]
MAAEQRAAAQSTPAELAMAGVAFGFTTMGMNANQNVFTQAKLAMAKGLSEADAWKALTLDAAQAIGVGSQLGSIEAGKLANLVVATADPLGAASSTNKWIMVAGHLLPVHPPAAGGGRGRGARGGAQ